MPAAAVADLRQTPNASFAAEEFFKGQAQKLLRKIDAGNVAGLRDRVVLGVLAYTDARVGAVAKLRLTELVLYSLHSA